MQIDTSRQRSRIVAVLGPTNTGKTHLAMERMLGHRSGMIGFPLRLLARENYDRACAIKGKGLVALITGEEKIIPKGARYFLCTAESMPLDRETAFVGIDEVQMGADPDRGHVFTARLLSARGTEETMFMGSDTIKGLLRQLVPEAEFVSRPRMSTLSYAGACKTARLKPRTAIVAFSASEVYGLAELVRRQRGGAAVVLGALSPRTRNAQVAMYQDGEVDYLVATDAIGMGLNMDVDHVAFAGTRKFDGRVQRQLTASELAQTAGRAGRHMNDGTFGTTGAHGPLDADLVSRIENHHFEPLKFLCWRNPDLDFSSLEALTRSLAAPPRTPGLMKARPADDELVLGHLAREPDVAALAAAPGGLRRLWDVCRIPDFGKVMSDAHARLLGAIYRHLMAGEMAGEGRIPTDWMAAQVTRLERTDGDIETLAGRIASIRTWTYVSYHSDWLDDAGHWQELTRSIEDKLSDALHLGLTQRFVDRRTSILLSRIREREDLLAAVDGRGDVTVEGHFVGRLEGFRFIPDDNASLDDDNLDGAARKTVTGAAQRALRGEIAARLRRLEADGDDMFALAADDSGWQRRLQWRGQDVARLTAGPGLLKPVAAPLASELLENPARDRVRRRLQAWLDRRIRETLAPLFLAAAGKAAAAELTGPVKGILFQLSEALGSLGRDAVGDLIGALGRADRKVLRQMGVRIGRHGVYMPALLKPGAVAMRGLLWVVHREIPDSSGPPPPPLPPGRVSTGVIGGAPDGFYGAQGYVRFGALAVRRDMVERLASKAWALARKGPFTAGPELLSLAGCGADGMTDILTGLGYRAGADEDGVLRFRPRDRAPGKNKGKNKAKHKAKSKGKGRGKAKVKAKAKPKAMTAKKLKVTGDSPFAKLRDLTVAR